MKRKKICFIVPSLGTARVFLLNEIKELNVYISQNNLFKSRR